MPTIKFTKDYSTKEATPQEFKNGDVVAFDDDANGEKSADHYVNRGVAARLEGDVPVRGVRRVSGPPAAEAAKKPGPPGPGPAHQPEPERKPFGK